MKSIKAFAIVNRKDPKFKVQCIFDLRDVANVYLSSDEKIVKILISEIKETKNKPAQKKAVARVFKVHKRKR